MHLHLHLPAVRQTTEIARLRSDVVESATSRTRREQGFSRMQLQLDQALVDRNSAAAEAASLRERLQVTVRGLARLPWQALPRTVSCPPPRLQRPSHSGYVCMHAKLSCRRACVHTPGHPCCCQDSESQVLSLRSQVHALRVEVQTASDAASAATTRAEAAERQVAGPCAA
jgi:hypothetical protein